MKKRKRILTERYRFPDKIKYKIKDRSIPNKLAKKKGKIKK
jgi:hypothetical protein